MKLNKFIFLFSTFHIAIASFMPLSTVSALEKTTGDIILTVTGNIGQSNTADGDAAFDRKSLRQFTPVTISTKTPWTDGIVQFEGVLIRDLMHALDAKGKILHATAADDYSVNIPFEDFKKYNVILAYKMNDKIMASEDQGPFWVIYPWDNHPELNNDLYHSRAIWQLKTITVK
ncbi:MAG: molybdopterin-dependent oxidoreductase [Sneathiella sp.]|nr:molybdopterin-dependent oxidoreductase [Sneathiella sp.]